jgi:flagellar biogenesis protein FliO
MRASKVWKWVFVLCFFVTLLFSPIVHAQESPKKEGVGTVPQEGKQGAPQKQAGPGAQAGAEVRPVPEEEPAPAYEYTEPEFGENRLSYPILVLRTLAILAVIIIGIFLLFRFLVKKRNRVVTHTEIIKIHATYPLAANRVIQVVEIAEKMLVLGVSDANINLITELQDKDTIDRIKMLSSKENKGGQGFKDQFMKLLGGQIFSRGGQISNFSNYKKRIDRMKKL